MDFVFRFLRASKGFDSVWVVKDRLTRYAHFLAVKTSMSLEKLTELYIDQIVRLPSIPVIIISDRDSRFVVHFWKSLHQALGTKLTFSTTFHPWLDEQLERTIQILEDMLRACMLDFWGPWD